MTKFAPIAAERQHFLCGVPGRMMPVHAWPNASHLFSSQKWISESRDITGYGKAGKITAKISFDDQCQNGHNTFAIVGEVATAESLKRSDVAASGCLHDEIALIFPELAHLTKWHLVSTDGPMGYLRNAVYLAGNRCFRGKLKGEPYSFVDAVVFGDNPVTHRISSKFASFLKGLGCKVYDFEIIGYDHKDRQTYGTRYTFGGFGEAWHEAPFKTEREALNFLYALQNCSPCFVEIPDLRSEGKGRQLEAARKAAVWPDATDEQLMTEPAELRAVLASRLPGLLASFRADVEAAGFDWGAA